MSFKATSTLLRCVVSLYTLFELFSLAHARRDDSLVQSYQLSDFSLTTVLSSTDFDLFVSHRSQPLNTIFSFSKYYNSQGTRIPFLFVSNTSLTQTPIEHGHQQLFLNNQKFHYYTSDITIDSIDHSETCLNISGSLLFNPDHIKTRKLKKLDLQDIPYEFSLCLALDPYYPQYGVDTPQYSSSSLNLNIQLLPEVIDNNDITDISDEYQHGQRLSNIEFIKQFNRICFSFDVQSADEAYMGFGEQFSYFNLRGKVIPIVVSEQGVGRGLEPITTILNNYWHGAGGYWHTTYAPKALFLSNRNYSLLFENYDIMIMDMASSDENSNLLEIFADSTTTKIEGKLIFGQTPLDLIEEITLITGRMRPLPKWVSNGHIFGTEGGEYYVMNKTMELVNAGVNLAGIWLQDWVGLIKIEEGVRLIWNWHLNSLQYPNFNEMVAKLRYDYNIRVMTYINPYFANVSYLQGDDTQNYFEQGINGGYFLKNESGDPYLIQSLSIGFATVDLTNPDAVRWIKDIIINHMIKETGISGFMADFGEYAPFDSYTEKNFDVDNNQITQSTHHNYYSEMWSRVVREAIEESGYGDEVVAFHRSGTIKSPKYATAFWAGDQLVTFDHYDGLQSVLYALFSSNLCGMTNTHSDVGGYVNLKAIKFVVEYLRTQELMQRWIELSTFSDVVFRGHPGTLPNDSIQIFSSEPVVQHIKYFSNIFKLISDYKHKLIQDAYEYGKPVLRHLYINYPYDKNIQDAVIIRMDEIKDKERKEKAITIHEQFMLGNCMLVAPVVHKGQLERLVYIPKGIWINFWDENDILTSEGEFIKMKTPIGKPPVFVCEEWKQWKYGFATDLIYGNGKKNVGKSIGIVSSGMIVATVIGIIAVLAMSGRFGKLI